MLMSGWLFASLGQPLPNCTLKPIFADRIVDIRYRADDPGLGMSTLKKWITAQIDMGGVSKADLSLTQETDPAHLLQIHQGQADLTAPSEHPPQGRNHAPIALDPMAHKASLQYPNGFYSRRRHSALGWKNPRRV